MVRKRLPATRVSITHKVTIGGKLNVYITVGLHKDWTPGEVYITVDQDSGQLGGMCEAFSIAISMLLQTPEWNVDTLAAKFSYMRFPPDGFTQNSEIQNAHSIPDYVFRWLVSRGFRRAVEERKTMEGRE